ncbi:ATP-binding protein [Geothrix fuzhouensis]|uniref:ATP-binding protein n=1 Tax=Geothrix fuzhouensis TaxID=2966451 RepID=UPI0021493160|nr:ATP-binding protein [Geothrix fuzhouensis]
MIQRDLLPILLRWAAAYPVVTLTGPRQSGKTTLCKAAFPSKPYVSLEPLETRAFALEDPRGFLAQYPDGAILDEVQHAAGLLSYIQDMVDRDPAPGRFILTGSQHFGLSEAVSQSLAGRTVILHLLPPSLGELRRFPAAPKDLFSTLFMGAYPRIHDQGIPPERWLADYVATYVQRDVRQVLNVGDLLGFNTFLRLCAGSTGQELNLSRLGADAGISQPTAKAWLSVLESSFLCFRLGPWHTNHRKRLVKAPKLHFYDAGLVCYLLGIRTAEQLETHPLRGSIFETWVASEVMKMHLHQGLEASAFHYREVSGLEVDLVIQGPDRTRLVELKSGRTIDGSWLKPLLEAKAALEVGAPNQGFEPILVYGGDQRQRRNDVEIRPWDSLEDLGPSPDIDRG